MRTTSERRAFVAAELLAGAVVVGLVAVFVVVAGDGARRRCRVAGSISNLQEFAAGAGSFAADNADRWFSFSWHRDEIHEGADGYRFTPADNDTQAFADQAVAIIRYRGQRPDIGRIFGWAAPILYNHLALVDYLGMPLPAEFTASPSDRNLLAWQRASRVPGDQGAAYFALPNRPNPGASYEDEKRWPYMSSYRIGPCFFSPDAIREGMMTFSQATTHRTYYTGDSRTVLGVRRTSEVSHPANKVMVFEGHGEDESGRRCFYAYDRVRTPVLLADGAASVRSIADANPGFDPNSPNSPLPTRINYTAELSWEPPTFNGGASEFVFGRVQWTRSGLLGRDFGGPEVPWIP